MSNVEIRGQEKKILKFKDPRYKITDSGVNVYPDIRVSVEPFELRGLDGNDYTLKAGQLNVGLIDGWHDAHQASVEVISTSIGGAFVHLNPGSEGTISINRKVIFEVEHKKERKERQHFRV